MGDFVPTRASLSKKNVEKLLEVVTYEAPKKKLNPNKLHFKKEKKASNDLDEFGFDEDTNMNERPEPQDERRKQELEMKRFRHDVIKFGMSGFEKKKAKQAKIALAISLGAKPPKNKKKNYKKLIMERKVGKAQLAKIDKFASGFDIHRFKIEKDKIKSYKERKKDKKSKKKDKKGNSKLDNKSKPPLKKSKKGKKSDGILGVYGKVTKDTNHKKKHEK